MESSFNKARTAVHAPASGRARWSGVGVLVAYLACAALVVVGAILYLASERRLFIQATEERLLAIADLKVGQIEAWRRERLADARFIRWTPYAARRALDALAQPGSSTTRQMFTAWLDPVLARGPYARALVLDEQLTVRLVHPEGASAVVGEAVLRVAATVLESRRVDATDLHRDTADGPIHLSVMAPLVVREDGPRPTVPAAGTGTSATDRGAGVLLLQIDAERVLEPIVRSWPTPSATAETYLLRTDGDAVALLSELRHRVNTALRWRIPLAETNALAVRAARGPSGILRGRDYRGVETLAAVKAVPGTDWKLVAKVDQAELFAPLRQQAWTIALVVVTLLLAAAFAVGYAWKRARLRAATHQLAVEQTHKTLAERVAQVSQRAEAEIRRLNRLYATLSQVNQTMVHTTSREPFLDRICRVAVEAGGFKLAWIGWLDPQTRRVRPVASAGDAGGFLDELEISADPDLPEGRGLTGTALQTGQPCLSQDYSADARLAHWQALAAAKGFAAAGAFPVQFGGKTVAALMLYAAEPDFFQPTEVALLEEVAAGVSYALDKFHEEAERQRAQTALRHSEDLMRSIYRAMNEGLALHELVYDAAGQPVDYCVLDVNPAFEAHTGLPRAQVIGGLASAVYGTGSAPFLAEYAAVTATGVPVSFEVYFPPLARHFRIAAFTPRPGHFATVFSDITARKRLEESQARLTAIVEATSDFVGSATPDGRVLYLNRAGRRLTGRGETDDLTGASIADFHPEWAARKVLTEGLPVATRDGLWQGETALLTAAGGEIPVSQVIVAHRTKDGAVDYLSTIMRDLTERVRAETILQHQAAELRARNEELLRFNRAATGRELRMIELKREVNALCRQAGQPAPYPLDFHAEGA